MNLLRLPLLLLWGISIFALYSPCRADDWNEVRTGTLSYPALDNLDMREGTLECWVQLGFDTTPAFPAQKYTGFATLPVLQGENGGLSLGYQAQAGDKQASWFCSVGPETYFTPFFTEPAPWKKGEWHHFALEWKGAETWLLLDGKKVGGRVHQHTLFSGFGPVGAKPIFIGNKWGVGTMLAIDDFRLSRVTRRPEELGFNGQLKNDVYTTILDSFEEEFIPDGKTSTHPAVMLSGSGGLATPPCQFVPGKFGKALSFWKQ